MPKPKRRNPIVPVTKAAVHQSVPKDTKSKPLILSQPTRRDHEPEAGSSRVGGGHGKRQRESKDVDLKRRHFKRQKTHINNNARRGWDGADTAGSQWRPLSVVHQQAAFAVHRLLEADSSRKHGTSVKSLTLAPHIEAKKATFAVTCQVLKFSQILEQIDQQAELTVNQPKLEKYVAMVLLYEVLRGQGLKRKGPAERAVLAAKPRLGAALEALLREEGVKSLDDLLMKRQRLRQAGTGSPRSANDPPLGPEVPHPRWVRVNLLKANVDDVVRQLDEHLQRTKGKQDTQKKVLEGKKQQKPKLQKEEAEEDQMQQHQEQPQVVLDPLLPDVLALPPGTALHDHPLVTRGLVVLQSKASCMPARALNPQQGWTVVDCCAAPGNKTTHLAALMGNTGRVLAFDKDARRLSRLQSNAALTGSSCIEARLADFLTLDPTAPVFREVRGVLLDPSCSGSGTTFTRMDHLLPSHQSHRAAATAEVAARIAGSAAANITTAREEGEEETEEGEGKCGAVPHMGEQGELGQALRIGRPEQDTAEAARVAQLARFQAAALSHALRFPSLERLVYSTCSVHVDENEAVVAGVLQQAAEAGLELADPFPSWHRRGLPLFLGAEKLVRTDAYLDGTDGFFVALFQRRKLNGETQEQEQGQKQKHGQQKQQQRKRQHPAVTSDTGGLRSGKAASEGGPQSNQRKTAKRLPHTKRQS